MTAAQIFDAVLKLPRHEQEEFYEQLRRSLPNEQPQVTLQRPTDPMHSKESPDSEGKA
jgi:hypothetical protein